MNRISESIELTHRGERAAARRLFAVVWKEVGGEGGEPLHRCALAHSMADLQDDLNEELLWDRRALAAADQLTEERVARAGVTIPVAAFYPSLHLNLAECYRKLGDVDQARRHVRRDSAVVSTLPEDGYGRMIKGALQRLADRLPST